VEEDSYKESHLCRLLGNPVAFAVVELLAANKELSPSEIVQPSTAPRTDMKITADTYGAELWDYYKTKDNRREIVERDDKFIDNRRDGYGGSVYFAEYKHWAPLEKKAITYARGRVLDVGCGAGRHALYLQKKGFDVTGIDASPLAIKICKLRGLRKARILRFDDIAKFKPNSFDTVIFMGNNFGLFGGFKKSKMLLRKLHMLTSDNATLVATSMNPYKTKNPDHKRYHKLNLKRGRMAGQLRIRIRHANLIGPWFDYLLVSKKEMKTILSGTGWRVKKFIEGSGPGYAAVIIKSSVSH
jgi:SAM-dependent methyltransferase